MEKPRKSRASRGPDSVLLRSYFRGLKRFRRLVSTQELAHSPGLVGIGKRWSRPKTGSDTHSLHGRRIPPYHVFMELDPGVSYLQGASTA